MCARLGGVLILLCQSNSGVIQTISSLIDVQGKLEKKCFWMETIHLYSFRQSLRSFSKSFNGNLITASNPELNLEFPLNCNWIVVDRRLLYIDFTLRIVMIT